MIPSKLHLAMHRIADWIVGPVIRQVVARASRVLDETASEPYHPWFDRERLDVGRLNMMDTTDCLLGQLYGNYRRAPDVFFDEPVQAAFCAPPPIRPGSRASRRYYTQLNIAWTNEICRKRIAYEQPLVYSGL